MPTSDLSIERPAPYIAVLRYSRPQSLNPLNVAVRREMAEHLNALAEDDGVRVVVLAGTEKAFAAGADLVEMSKADAARAIQSLNGQDMGGRPLKVNEAQDKPRGGGGGFRR